MEADAVNENNSKDINYQTLPEMEDEYLTKVDIMIPTHLIS